MSKLAQRGHEAAASFLVPSIALLLLVAALLAVALFPSAGIAAEEGEGGGAPQLTFSPGPLDLGKATVGTETNTVAVEFQNQGTAGIAVDKVELVGADPGDFKLNSSSCGWVEIGQSCSAWIAFAPSASGARGAVLSVQLKEAPTQTLTLQGEGVAPQVSFNPSAYDFGIQRTNESQAAAFQLTNSGEAFVQIGSIGTGGADSGNFWTNNGDCWNGRRLDPGESCNLQVNFNAWDAVGYAAELQANVNGTTFTAALSGTGGRPELQADANPVQLGSATVGSEGAVRTITLTNHGNLGGAFFIAVIAGGDSGSFRLLDESCTGVMLVPGATCTAHVRLTPQSAGTKSARFALFGEGDGGTMVELRGEGVAPAVQLTPAALDFGDHVAGEVSAARSVLVRNDGTAPLALGAVGIAGLDLDQFFLAGDECSEETLAPGEECQLRVRFAPDSSGGKAATLRVRAAGGSTSAALGGNGVDAGEADSGQGALSARAGQGGRSSGPERHRARQRRFSRNDAVASAHHRALRRATGLRPRTIPR